MFSKYRNKTRASVDINMTPMIDIVFQLLTFFMVTSTFIQTASLNVNLPETETSDSISVEQNNTITLYKDNSITWNDEAINKSELPELFTKLKKDNPNVSLIIQGDQDISYGILIEIMDLARIAGIENLNLATVLKK